MIKSRRLKCAGHVARFEDVGAFKFFLQEKRHERDLLKCLAVHGRKYQNRT